MTVFVWVPVEEWNGRVRRTMRGDQFVWQKPIGLVYDEGRPRFVEAIELTQEQYERGCRLYGLDQ